jgi:hypothetical protein
MKKPAIRAHEHVPVRKLKSRRLRGINPQLNLSSSMRNTRIHLPLSEGNSRMLMGLANLGAKLKSRFEASPRRFSGASSQQTNQISVSRSLHDVALDIKI